MSRGGKAKQLFLNDLSEIGRVSYFMPQTPKSKFTLNECVKETLKMIHDTTYEVFF